VRLKDPALGVVEMSICRFSDLWHGLALFCSLQQTESSAPEADSVKALKGPADAHRWRLSRQSQHCGSVDLSSIPEERGA
jgi:predicted double-glycine peptidase